MVESRPPITPQMIKLLTIGAVIDVLGIISVILRLWARKMKRYPIGIDDYLVICALPLAASTMVCNGIFAMLGVGYDISQIPQANNAKMLQVVLAYEVFFTMTLFLVKMSILFFYLRVFKAEKRVRLFTKIYMGLIILWTIGNILLTFLLCRPFRSYWDIAVKGTCGDKIASFVALGVYNTITDFFILTLPIRTLWKLHLPKPRRFTLIGVFCFGLLVSILSIIRMVAVSRVDLANFPLTAVFSVFWSSVEPNAAVICVCLPMLQPILPRQFRERGDSISMIGDQEDVESPEGRFYMSPSSGGGGGPHILL